MRSGVNRVLLSRETKRVPTHRMHHLDAKHSLISRGDVSGSVPFRVANMQTRATGVREHIQHVILFLPSGQMSVLLYTERLVLVPIRLPLLLNDVERIQMLRLRRRGGGTLFLRLLCRRLRRTCTSDSAAANEVIVFRCSKEKGAASS